MSSDFRERFWDVICDYRHLIKPALGINFLLFGLTLLAVPGVSPGSPAYVILVVDMVVLGGLIFGTAFLLWRCKRRVTEDRF